VQVSLHLSRHLTCPRPRCGPRHRHHGKPQTTERGCCASCGHAASVAARCESPPHGSTLQWKKLVTNAINSALYYRRNDMQLSEVPSPPSRRRTPDKQRLTMHLEKTHGGPTETRRGARTPQSSTCQKSCHHPVLCLPRTDVNPFHSPADLSISGSTLGVVCQHIWPQAHRPCGPRARLLSRLAIRLL
jgi:hypothetical protein